MYWQMWMSAQEETMLDLTAQLFAPENGSTTQEQQTRRTTSGHKINTKNAVQKDINEQ